MKCRRQVVLLHLLACGAVGIMPLLGACSDNVSYSFPPNSPGGATITVYAAGAPGSAATALVTLSTSSSGGLDLTGAYACPSPNVLIYAVASGGSGTESLNANIAAINPSIELMAALGPCSSAPSHVVINELTTVAAVYALNAFRTISAANPLGDMTQLSGKTPAINNAFATAALLADVKMGLPATSLPTAATCLGDSPTVNCFGLGRLTALANALAACVRTAAGSAPCTQLFGDTGASNTLQATLFIARNPGQVNIQDVYDLSTQNSLRPLVPFHINNAAYVPQLYSPGVSATPTDWTISLNFTSGFPSNGALPIAIAIDANGNVWIPVVTQGSGGGPAGTASSYLVALSPIGLPMAGSPYVVSPAVSGIFGPSLSLAFDFKGDVWIANPNIGVITVFNSSALPLGGTLPLGDYTYTGGDESNPVAIAIDGMGNGWLANGNWTVTALSSSAAPLTGSPYVNIGLDAPTAIAIDGSNNIWVANTSASVTALNSSGAPLTGSPYTGGGLGGGAIAIAIDSTDNVWVANSNSSVTALNASGAPLAGSPYTGGGLNGATAMAIDGDGNVWVANTGPFGTGPFGQAIRNNGSITELSSSGQPASPGSGFTGGFTNVPSGIAVDGAGDVWVTNNIYYAGTYDKLIDAASGVTEFIGAAAPTVTPLVAQFRHATTPPPPYTPPPTAYSVGGTVSGLTGAGLVLQDNGGDSLSVAANGAFIFAKLLLSGTAYAVTVLTQPLGQSCSAANGMGTVGSANVTSVVVTCTTSKTSGLTCLPAPSPKGGGAQVYDNQSFCAQLAGTTDLGTSFSGTLTFTTPLTPGPIIGCQYLVSLSPSGTAPTACAGTTDASGNLSIVDAVNESNSNTRFTGIFAPSAVDTVTGSWSSGNFAPAGGAVVTGNFSGTQQ